MAELMLRNDESLIEILSLIEQADDGVISQQHAKEAFLAMATKVDNIYELLGHFAAIEERIANKQKELLAAKKTVINRTKRLKEYVQWSMEHTKQPEIRGDLYRFKTSTRTASKLCFMDNAEDDQSLMSEFAETDMVKVKYSWNKDLLKTLLSNDPTHPVSNFCYLQDTTSLRSGVITK